MYKSKLYKSDKEGYFMQYRKTERDKETGQLLRRGRKVKKFMKEKEEEAIYDYIEQWFLYKMKDRGEKVVDYMKGNKDYSVTINFKLKVWEVIYKAHKQNKYIDEFTINDVCHYIFRIRKKETEYVRLYRDKLWAREVKEKKKKKKRKKWILKKYEQLKKNYELSVKEDNRLNIIETLFNRSAYYINDEEVRECYQEDIGRFDYYKNEKWIIEYEPDEEEENFD
jgi:hypothetical protein